MHLCQVNKIEQYLDKTLAKHARHVEIMSPSVLTTVVEPATATYFLFLINNFGRGESISFKIFRMLKHLFKFIKY